MSRKLLLKVVSITLALVTFFYTTPISAVERRDKLAAKSVFRFTEYFSSGKNLGLLDAKDTQKMEIFTDAVKALRNILAEDEKTRDDINRVIKDQNEKLREIGLTISDVDYDEGIPYVVLFFGSKEEKDKARELVFLKDYSKMGEGLTKYGIKTDKDRTNLEIPGVNGCWARKYTKREYGLPAGGEIAANSSGEKKEARDTMGNLTEKKKAILRKIEELAKEYGFTNIEVYETNSTNARRIMEVVFESYTDNAKSKVLFRLKDPARLNVFEHTLTRLSNLREIFGNRFVEEFIRDILSVEKARTQFAEEFINNCICALNYTREHAFREAALLSLIAMAKMDGKIKEGGKGIKAKRKWTRIVGRYFWIAYMYDNTAYDLFQRNESMFTDILCIRIRELIREVSLDTINRHLRKYFNEEVAQYGLEGSLFKIIPEAWRINTKYVTAMEKRQATVTEFGLAAGTEGEADHAAETNLVSAELAKQLKQNEALKQAEQIVIDLSQWKRLSTYKKNPETGVLEETSGIPLKDDSIPALNGKLVVITAKIGSNGMESLFRTIRVITVYEEDLIVDSVIQCRYHGEIVDLFMNLDRTIYVLPYTDIHYRVYRSMNELADAALKLQGEISKAEAKEKIRGFVKLDAGLMRANNPIIQNGLYARLQELYSEGMYAVSVVNGEAPDRFKSIISKFAERSALDEWKAVQSNKDNTISIVLNTDDKLVAECEQDSTVIKLEYSQQIDPLGIKTPQLFHALFIARAIISAGGVEKVKGEVLMHIKTMYLHMAGENYGYLVSRARTISELLSIILPPILINDVRIYEHLLIGKQAEGIAA